MLCHENQSITLQHYPGFFTSDLDSVANRLETDIEKARDSASR
ncbi:MAG: hypothetical protein WAS07_13890 [Micropruina sp.]